MMSTTADTTEFNIVEASIEDHRQALNAGRVTSVELVVSYLNRIATYDICGGLNAFTVFNEEMRGHLKEFLTRSKIAIRLQA
jgi:Asp-tRNA(Asn)/Glu-tRNA(Gln) amidotransferase A subunit family amidase